MKLLSEALQEALDSMDFDHIANYMQETNWSIEDLHDGRGPDDHRRFIPDAAYLRQHVVRGSRDYLSLAEVPCGWTGLGFDIWLVVTNGEPTVRIRFTDIRPILVESS